VDLADAQTNHDVELVCGDWFGGALISSNHPDSYTLYAVGKDGKLRWQHTATGLRKGLAISLDHLVYLLSQSADGNAASLEGLDELSGAKKFAHPIPASTERQASVRKEGAGFVCTSGIISGRSRTTTSRVIVNMDGFAYLAFTQNTRTLGTAKCVLGSTVDPSQMYLARDESLRLWQIHPDGTYRSTVVEAMRGKQSLTAPVSTVSPLTSIVTDNMNGILLPVQMSSSAGSASGSDTTGEVIYRIDPNGEVVYKFPLPKYAGPMHDEMVIGEDDVAFATRGGILIAFNLRVGREIWRWDSNTPEISVFAALANGDCIVQTPKGLVEVESATRSKEVMGGKVMMDWQGQMYRKHN
jgi:outer membrane protein assembly factor BamB